MECYAPLFVNTKFGTTNWPTNLMGYDPLSSYGSPSYYAQKMFSTYHGDAILGAALSNAPSLYESVTRDSARGTVYIKIVNTAGTAQTVAVTLSGVIAVAPERQSRDDVLGKYDRYQHDHGPDPHRPGQFHRHRLGRVLQLHIRALLDHGTPVVNPVETPPMKTMHRSDAYHAVISLIASVLLTTIVPAQAQTLTGTFTGTDGSAGTSGAAGSSVNGGSGTNGAPGYMAVSGATVTVTASSTTFFGGAGGDGGDGGSGAAAGGPGGNGGAGGSGGSALVALAGSHVSLFGGQYIGGTAGLAGSGGSGTGGFHDGQDGAPGQPGSDLFANGGIIDVYGTGLVKTTQNGVAVITGTLRNNAQSSTIVYTIANGGQINLNPAPEPSERLILYIGVLILTGRVLRGRLRRIGKAV